VGGGGSHTLPNHVTGSGQSTRHSRMVITLRPGALLEISFLFLNSRTPIKSTHYFCDWGRQYSQVRFPAIQDILFKMCIAECPAMWTDPQLSLLSTLSSSISAMAMHTCEKSGDLLSSFLQIFFSNLGAAHANQLIYIW
jgi:hypothetical protein